MEKLLKLYEFQKIDIELYNLENTIKKSESRKKLLRAKNVLLDGQKTAQQYEKDIEQKKNDIEDIIRKYDSLSDQVAQLVKESADIKEGEEVKDMRKKAENINVKLKKVQASIIDGLNQVKDVQKKYHDLMVKLQKAKQEFIENKETHTKEIEGSQGKIDELKAVVAKMEKDLDKELYAVYKEKKKNGMPVIVKVSNKDRQCAGCFMELPSSVFENAKTKEDIVECENCGRILLFE